MTLVLLSAIDVTKFQEKFPQRGIENTGMGKIAIFDKYRQFLASTFH